jgi:hypothetical protein
MVSSNSWRNTHDAKNKSALPCGEFGELNLMSGELFVTAKLNARSSAVSVFCCSGKLCRAQSQTPQEDYEVYLLKHIAVRSEVAKGVLGGYRISISGLRKSATAASSGRSALTYPTSTLKLQTILSLLVCVCSSLVGRLQLLDRHSSESLTRPDLSRRDYQGKGRLTMLHTNLGSHLVSSAWVP